VALSVGSRALGAAAEFYGWLDPIVSASRPLAAFPVPLLAVGLAGDPRPALFTAVIAIGRRQIPRMIPGDQG